MKKPQGKYAWSVTVGAKGQIVIPKEARAENGPLIGHPVRACLPVIQMP